MSRTRTVVVRSATAGVVFVLMLVVVFVWRAGPWLFKGNAERLLSDRLGLTVEIGSLSATVFPRPRVVADAVTIRVPSQPDQPPFASINRLWIDVGPLTVLRHIGTMHVDDLEVVVPARDKQSIMPADSAGGSETKRKIVIDHVVIHNTTLRFLRSDPAKQPFEFEIHHLSMDDVSSDGVMTFSTGLTIPLPKGLVESRGTLGPWVKGDPTALPVTGTYTFTSADLATLPGIGGTLSSTGEYRGRLAEISVTGKSDTPNFGLDMGGATVPLSATFEAVVDASDGTTRLQKVNARLLNTSLQVQGIIENLPGPGGHRVDLQVRVDAGQLEDLLTVIVNAKRPPMTGKVSLDSRIVLPPGKEIPRDRLQLSGKFAITGGRMSEPAAQAKVRELSQRSRPDDLPEIRRIDSAIEGQFLLKAGRLALSNVAFSVPGASVRLDGTYALADKQLDLVGVLRMQATVSQAVGGSKSWFLKPFDFWFRRDGAGAVIPIAITGAPDDPHVGVRLRKALTRSQ